MTEDHELPKGVLSPDDLELNDDRIEQLSEDRYLVGTDGQPLDHGDGMAATLGDKERAFADLEGAYALSVRARADGDAWSHCVETNDVSEAFESLVRWYAGCVAPERTTERVLAVLLEGSEIDVAVEQLSEAEPEDDV
jgi:hypothetical protein